MTTLTPTPKQQFLDANGNPLVGGKVYTYAAGTTSPLTTYTDQSGSVPNTNPVILDSRGEAAIWLGVASYKLKLTTSTDVEIWTVDNIVSASVQALADLSESGGSALVGYLPAGTGAVATTVQAKLRQTVSVKDFGAVGDGTTDDTAAIQAAATYAASTAKTLFAPTPSSQYLITSTVTINSPFIAEWASGLGNGSIGPFVARSNITVFRVIGSRLNIENIGIHFDLSAPATSNAIGFLFGDSTTQFSNNFVRNCYVRYAYNAFKANNAGTGTLWNNTFVNCRGDLSQHYAWYFDALVGSTTQTWIDCMNDGEPTATTGAGWYTNNVDDVAFINCQSDDCYDGNAIYINLATTALVKNFRSEGTYFRTNASQLIYCNATADISNVKLESSVIQVGAGNRMSVVRFGASAGGGVVGDIILQTDTITSGTVYRVDTNGLQFGKGNAVITGSNIKLADVRRDDVGDKTRFANKFGRMAAGNAAPTAGTFEAGDQYLTVSVSGTRSDFGKLCITSGTAGTLSGVTGSVASGGRLVTVSSTANISEGSYITIAGVSGVKRVVHVYDATSLYIDSDSDATVTTNGVSFSAPAFKLIGGAGKGTTAQRPSPGANDYGAVYLDTTLDADGKPIWWNGTAWVDATGAVV
jgi:hypothetical protein